MLDSKRFQDDALQYLFGDRPDPMDGVLDVRIAYVGELHQQALQHYYEKDTCAV